MSCSILRAIFTWLALKIPWLTANMAPEIGGVTEIVVVALNCGGSKKLPSKRPVPLQSILRILCIQSLAHELWGVCHALGLASI
jgi:hypothetical protein